MEKKNFANSDMEPHVYTLFETSTSTWQWIVADPETKDAVVIDPVLDSQPQHHGICTTAADRILDLVQQNQYRVIRILETHSHREHKTSSWYLRAQIGNRTGNMPRICTGRAIAGVQRMFARQYRITDAGWNAHFDSAFRDGQVFNIGQLKCDVMQLGPERFGFIIGRNVFTGGDAAEFGPQSTKRLEQFPGYTFHPNAPGSEGGVSRPTTAATDFSEWPGARPSISKDPMVRQAVNRPPSQIHEMAG